MPTNEKLIGISLVLIKKIAYPNYIMDNNKLSGLAFNLPQNKFIIVEEATRPIPVPRKWYRDENDVWHPIPAPRKKNGDKSYTDKYQKHTACSYGYKLVCFYDDKYTKPVKIYRGEDSKRNICLRRYNTVGRLLVVNSRSHWL